MVGKGSDYKVHGSKGVYCGGDWIDIEDCTDWLESGGVGDRQAHAAKMRKKREKDDGSFDVVIIGAGCIGSAIARELAKTKCSVLLLERDDDVSQSATKGNSGIVHSGLDPKEGTRKAFHNVRGASMFPDLDRDLRFGFLKNGSLNTARGSEEEAIIEELLENGNKNGVPGLRIVKQKELREMEPEIHPEITAALYAPSAGTVAPYEYTIALAENACDNGVDVRIRHQVKSIEKTSDGGYIVKALNWDPDLGKEGKGKKIPRWRLVALASSVALGLSMTLGSDKDTRGAGMVVLFCCCWIGLIVYLEGGDRGQSTAAIDEDAVHPTLAFKPANKGKMVKFKTSYVINCAGLFADKIAEMVGDKSFKIKPRLGDYLLLHKDQGHLAKHILFPCPDPHLGKGVLVQTTIWGNLILGPTARDVNDPKMLNMTDEEVFKYILGKCSALVPSLDASHVIHSFCGARAKSDQPDWVIDESKVAPGFINVAGIDSPGLAGSPSIAIEVVEMLGKMGLKMEDNPDFNPVRLPLIVPKNGWKTKDGEKLRVYRPTYGPDEFPAHTMVMCKCEKVTEAEIMNSLKSSLTVDNTQAVRRRTRAGMGHCQAGSAPHCEDCVVKCIAKQKAIKVEEVGRRPWPATSLLPHRWLSDEEKQYFKEIQEEARE